MNLYVFLTNRKEENRKPLFPGSSKLVEYTENPRGLGTSSYIKEKRKPGQVAQWLQHHAVHHQKGCSSILVGVHTGGNQMFLSHIHVSLSSCFSNVNKEHILWCGFLKGRERKENCSKSLRPLAGKGGRPPKGTVRNGPKASSR